VGGPLSRFFWRAAGAFYGAVDRLYRWWHGLEPAGELLYVGRTVWKGPPRRLADGTELSPGDPLASLHFNNRFIAADGGGAGNEAKAAAASGAMGFARSFLPAFRALARKLSEEPRWRDVVAVYAVSWIPPQAERFGFEFQRLPDGLRTRLIRWHIGNLMTAANFEAGRRRRGRLWPMEILLSRRLLLENFLRERPSG
jgi:hypothetical protein